MPKKNPYSIIKHLHVTEKTRVLQELKNSDSNKCIARCEAPKYVFVVDKAANKREIADAVEEIYSEKNIKVISVNTITLKGKPRRVRGRKGRTASIKKAVVTLEKNDSLDEL
jgi:large subunit ribosomal protein L23